MLDVGRRAFNVKSNRTAACEKEMIYEEFKDRAGEIVSGTVRRFVHEHNRGD
jgi:hypothetical protein